METLKIISAYAKIISPFLAAVLSALNTYEARGRFWRFVGGIVVTLILLAIGIGNVVGVS